MNFWERYFGGHLNIGKRITVYGENAMHWAVNIHTKRWGYVCFRLPVRCFGRWWPLYFYVSPNATPWAATFLIGGDERCESRRASERRKRLGHNFASSAMSYDQIQGVTK